jgi:hypothetical protein
MDMGAMVPPVIKVIKGYDDPIKHGDNGHVSFWNTLTGLAVVRSLPLTSPRYNPPQDIR